MFPSSGIHVRVIDPFTLKPIDKDLLILSAAATGGKIITVEDHYYEGGLGEAVVGALSLEVNIQVKKIAVDKLPRSGPPAALLELYGISRNKIVKAVKDWI